MAEEPNPELLGYATGKKDVKISFTITEVWVTSGSHRTPFMLHPVVSRNVPKKEAPTEPNQSRINKVVRHQAIPIKNYFPGPQNIPGLFEGENSCRISIPRQYIRS